jgi:hypothetical protein
MNATYLLINSHNAICTAVEGLTSDQWEQPDAVGTYSPKQVIAHLIAYEQMTEGVVNTLLGRDTSQLQELRRKMDEMPDSFNDVMVAQYAPMSGLQVLAKLTALHLSILASLDLVEPHKLSEVDTLDWYLPGSSVEDFLIYANFGHKTEHAAQLTYWRERIAAG